MKFIAIEFAIDSLIQTQHGLFEKSINHQSYPTNIVVMAGQVK